MKLLGKSSSPDLGDVTPVNSSASDSDFFAGGPVESPDPGAGATPVPTRLGRLAAVVDKARKSGGGRNIRKWLETIGMSLIAFGFVCILLGWYGASHSAYQYQEIPYLISGGLLGVALVIGGGVLVHSAWSLRKIEEDRRNALAIVRSVDRLERIMRSLDESRRDDKEDIVL